MKRSLIALAALVAAAFPISAAEVGQVSDNRLDTFPTYSAFGEVALVPGATFGAGYSALVNLNGVAATLLPVLDKLPRIWVDSQAVVWDMGPLFGMEKAGSSLMGDMGAFLGFGGQTFRLGAGLSLWEGDDYGDYRWIISESSSTSGNVTTTTTTYWPISGPELTSLQAVGSLSFDRVGGDWKNVSTAYTEKYALGDGMKAFLHGGLRWMNAHNFVYRNDVAKESRTYRGWSTQELTVAASLDFKMYGLDYEMALLGDFIGTRIGMGLYLRNDAPKGKSALAKDDDLMRSLYLPMWVTLGLGGTPIALSDADRNWQKD